jgi:hypothetical protein
VVVAIAGAVAGVVATSSDDSSGTADAKPSASLAATPTSTPPSEPATDLPAGSPTSTDQLVPYVVLAPGKCFDSPTLSPGISEVVIRSCTAAHDAEVIANETLTGAFTSDAEIQRKALELCTADAKRHLPQDGKLYYPYVLFPKLVTYQVQDRTTVTCSLTRDNGTNGVKLHSKLG